MTVAIRYMLGMVKPRSQSGNGLNDPPAAPGHPGGSEIWPELLWSEDFQAGGVSRFVNLALFQPRNYGFGF